MALRPSTRPVWISLLLLVLAVAGCEKQQVIELGKQTITADTTWQGVVVVAGDIYIPPEVTLTIAPGTTVKFKRIDEKSDQNMFATDSPYYPQAELIIRGRLIARGTDKKRIVFTSAEVDARPSDWGAINFLGSEGNVVSFAKVLFAYNGIHAHGAAVEVSDCEFAKNGVGISFKSEEETPDVPWFGKGSDLTITRCTITGNKGGIGLRNSKAKITRNVIRDNKFFGIWPKEKVDAVITENEITSNKKGVYLFQTQGMTLHNNNIYDNTDHNIGVAEAQDFEVDATNNWFGTVNREKIAASIYDKKNDPEVASIIFEPFLDKKVPLEGH